MNASSARPPGRRSAADFAALPPDAAAGRLEDMAGLAPDTTLRRFGRTMHLFAPLYLSNECVSVCTYCGFSAGNDIARRTLTPDEVAAEGRALVEAGFRPGLLGAAEPAPLGATGALRGSGAAQAPAVPPGALGVQVWEASPHRD